LLTLESEEERTGPAGAGNQTSDLRKTVISRASIFIALGFDIDEVDLVLPFPDETCARLDHSNR
jgi:hypothetical protein